MMLVDDLDDPLEQCPLQKPHMIRKSRMAVHLAKCVLQTNPGSQMVQCLYDSTHFVLQPLLGYHMAHVCDKRELFEKFVHQPDTNHNPNPPPVTQKTELPPTEENWDDGPLITYDPQQKASGEAVLRTLCVAPKSKRREFRQREMERFQELAQQGKVTMNLPARTPEPQPVPLRQPRVEVSRVIGAGRGRALQDEEKPLEPVGKQAIAPEVELEEAMGQLQLDKPKSENNKWVTVGRGHHKKKEFPELRKPGRALGAPDYVASNRDAIAVPRGRGKVSV